MLVEFHFPSLTFGYIILFINIAIISPSKTHICISQPEGVHFNYLGLTVLTTNPQVRSGSPSGCWNPPASPRTGDSTLFSSPPSLAWLSISIARLADCVEMSLSKKEIHLHFYWLPPLCVIICLAAGASRLAIVSLWTQLAEAVRDTSPQFLVMYSLMSHMWVPEVSIHRRVGLL